MATFAGWEISPSSNYPIWIDGAGAPHYITEPLGIIDVKNYGAKGDGSSDDTTALDYANAAANATPYGAIILLPPGNYIDSTPGRAQNTGVIYRGSGPGNTTITYTNSAVVPFSWNGAAGGGIERIKLNWATPGILGAAINTLNCYGMRFTDVDTNLSYSAYNLQGTRDTWLTRCRSIFATNNLGDGIFLGGANQCIEIHLTDCVFYGPVPNGAKGAAYHFQNAQGVWRTSCDTFAMGCGMLIDPGTGQSVFNLFEDNSADDYTNGGTGGYSSTHIAPTGTGQAWLLSFSNSWSAGALGGHGMYLGSNVSSVQISNHRGSNNAIGSGIVVDGATNILIANSLLLNNMSAGLEARSGSGPIVVQGGFFGNDPTAYPASSGYAQQKWGINAAVEVDVTGTNLTTNTAAAVVGRGVASSTFTNTRGFRITGNVLPATGQITIGGTPTTGDSVTGTVGGTAVTIFPTTGQTITQVAQALAAAINANGTLGPLVTATSIGSGVLTVTYDTPGGVGTTLSAGTTGGHTTAVASTAALKLYPGSNISAQNTSGIDYILYVYGSVGGLGGVTSITLDGIIVSGPGGTIGAPASLYVPNGSVWRCTSLDDPTSIVALQVGRN
jgi:hypothetical protein